MELGQSLLDFGRGEPHEPAVGLALDGRQALVADRVSDDQAGPAAIAGQVVERFVQLTEVVTVDAGGVPAERLELGREGLERVELFGGQVGLELVTVDDRDQVVRVLDRGAGMSEQVLKSALLPFYSTKQKGSGLGLPLCREIIEAHGGRLNLANRRDGGLIVEFSIPA